MDPEPRPLSPRRPSPGSSSSPSPPPTPRRLFLHEPGWRVGLKIGSERAFCYMMAPGKDYYHRLLDGEIYVFNGDERICLACAMRRGLLSFESRGLGGLIIDTDPAPDATPAPHPSGFDLIPPREENRNA